jgi:hypothetical protein
LESDVIGKEFDAGAVGVNAADCGVLNDGFDVLHGGHPFKLFSEVASDVFKVLDSLTEVERKMQSTGIKYVIPFIKEAAASGSIGNSSKTTTISRGKPLSTEEFACIQR